MRGTFISDFGGVLTSPISEGFLAYQEESNVSLEELGRAMARAGEAHGENPLYALERGELTEREFAERLERELPGGFSLTRLRELYFERLVPNAPMITFARSLRERGLRTALLTNNVREWEPHWRAKLPEIDEIFEVVVDSAFVGLRKPDRRIYELTLERVGAEAADCVFVDDLEVNCVTARELGMAAVRFEDTGAAIAAVEAALET
ncbi:MAG: HAD family phosphatase [Thermoleophilaceae bacterium]|nr:HAD family phosphatase [Thermoleophilaceae bacterium]